MTRPLRHCLALLAALGAIAVVTADSLLAQGPSATDMMAKANESYERGEYVEAVQQYESLLDRGYEDAAIFYNLGNAYLERGDVGRAILSYLRARKLSPRDPDIADSLALAIGMTVDRIEADRDSLVESVSHLARMWVTPSELGIAVLLLWILNGTAIGALVMWRGFPLRRLVRAVTVVGTAATVMSFLLLVTMTYANPYDNTGVVTVTAIEVVGGPGPQYSEEFALYSGAQVRIADYRHGWLRIELPGGELQGWVPSHAVEVVGGNS